MNKEVFNFWNEEHKKPESVFVSGTSFLNVISALEISEAMFVGKRVLEIGVGTGMCTSVLGKVCGELHALDVSREILDKVKDSISRGFTIDEIDDIPINYYDMAISFLVTQHMLDDELIVQIKKILTKIKFGGIFAMQFADVLDGQEYPIPDVLSQTHGGVCRNLSDMINIVNKCGGIITWASKPIYFAGNKFSKWHTIHISRI